MQHFNIDPHNDDLGMRVRNAKAFLAQIRRSGNAMEPDHFPSRSKR